MELSHFFFGIFSICTAYLKHNIYNTMFKKIFIIIGQFLLIMKKMF